ncbi:NAD-dependent epimerase/dehydratase family protein [Dyadobacter sandarakinus]|uniref:NAD-dependent epimerase/dehydratase family protein n=1 Tax=Dyadobacter sandarakinus TaxID=2747268 RepID=A0ABX7ICP2_9BACT|nr:NAD-dependent epimerase/dehydratase family protein [Dyadobacter sandarakinus]QRR03889.1 NAD-dependent epimerase/dehydratase family protein [Dyadobacter sandarakinus]
MKERVFITGASGFIGYHLVQAALEAGLEVHAAVRPSSNLALLTRLKSAYSDLAFVNTDFSSKNNLLALLKSGNYNYIIHGAGLTRAKTPSAYNLVNADYTLSLAEAAMASGIPLKRFVFLSSLAAIGPRAYDEKQPITESSSPAPVTDYGRSKLLAEQYLEKLTGLPLTIIRPTAVYGPGEKDLFVLFKTLNSGLDAYIGSKPQRLSFVYVQDLVDATLAALKEPGSQTKVYNISDGKAYDRYALADCFKAWSGKKAFRMHLPVALIRMIAGVLDLAYSSSSATPVLNKEKLNELTAPNWICSIDAARSNLNYQPRYDLAAGMAETLAWYKENRWL